MQQHSTKLVVPASDRDHLRGAPDAPVTLVEYGDYECPYCGRTHPIVKRLLADLDGRLRFAFRHFPMNSVHRHAAVAAMAAEAAGAQGNFWALHDLMFDHQEDLAQADLLQYALRVGLEIYRFEADLSSERFAGRVREDQETGQQSGVTGTPTLFINGQRYSGPLEYEAIRDAVFAAEGT